MLVLSGVSMAILGAVGPVFEEGVPMEAYRVAAVPEEAVPVLSVELTGEAAETYLVGGPGSEELPADTYTYGEDGLRGITLPGHLADERIGIFLLHEGDPAPRVAVGTVLGIDNPATGQSLLGAFVFPGALFHIEAVEPACDEVEVRLPTGMVLEGSSHMDLRGPGETGKLTVGGGESCPAGTMFFSFHGYMVPT